MTESCCACGRSNPPGGLRLTAGETYEWICKRAVACAEEIARQIRTGGRRCD